MLDKLFVMGQRPVTQTLRYVDVNTRDVLTSGQLQAAVGGIIALTVVDVDINKHCSTVQINYDQLLATMCNVSEQMGHVVDCPPYIAGQDPKAHCSSVLVNLNMACNQIATETRRAAGNVVFLDQTSYNFLTQCSPWMIHQDLFVDSTMPPGMALIAWKNKNTQQDGGYIAFHDTATNVVELCFTGTVEHAYYQVVKFNVPVGFNNDSDRIVQLNWRR